MTGVRGASRPVEPGTTSATVTWETLNDMRNDLRRAHDLVEAIFMAAESDRVEKDATNALHEVCVASQYRIENVIDLIDEAIGQAK